MPISRSRMARLLAGLCCGLATFALVLQLGLIIGVMTGQGSSALAAVWRYLGFFTILTNIAVAIVSGHLAFAPAGRGPSARVMLATLAAILFVGLVYSVALRHVWQPQGWQAVADHLLHDATPPAFLLTWLVASTTRLGWRDAVWPMAAPLAYCAYALVRGQADGWYAYWFLDPRQLGLAQMALNVIVLASAFLVLSLVLVGINRWLVRETGPGIRVAVELPADTRRR